MVTSVTLSKIFFLSISWSTEGLSEAKKNQIRLFEKLLWILQGESIGGIQIWSQENWLEGKKLKWPGAGTGCEVGKELEQNGELLRR